MKVRVSIIVRNDRKHYVFIKNDQGDVVAAFEIAERGKPKFDRIVLGPKSFYKVLVSEAGTVEQPLPIGFQSLVHRLANKYQIFPAVPVAITETVMEIQPRFPRVRPVASSNPKKRLAQFKKPVLQTPYMIIVHWNQKKIQQQKNAKQRFSMREISRQVSRVI